MWRFESERKGSETENQQATKSRLSCLLRQRCFVVESFCTGRCLLLKYAEFLLFFGVLFLPSFLTVCIARFPLFFVALHLRVVYRDSKHKCCHCILPWILDTEAQRELSQRGTCPFVFFEVGELGIARKYRMNKKGYRQKRRILWPPAT